MVCIAAFIILALVGVFVALVSIFKPKIWKSYVKVLKKSAGCLGKKVRLQKCETGFKDDVKNTLLSRVVIKHPKWLKPLSVLLEVLSVVIVVVVVWAIVTSIKSLLGLWALGTCNITKPSACTMGAEMCSIDESETSGFFEGIGRWFTEWGEIFEAIPDKFKTYNVDDYLVNYITADADNAEKPKALDIFDPGCSVCMISYRNQKASRFFDNYNVRLVPFAIQGADDEYKFKNSEIIVRYMFAVEQYESGVALKIIDRIFTEKDEEGVSYQSLFNDAYSREEAEKVLQDWLKEFGLNKTIVQAVAETAMSDDTTTKMQENREIVENQLKAKGIPTMVYDGKRHTGLYKVDT